jgi:Na+/H+-dicarboxylate symporter
LHWQILLALILGVVYGTFLSEHIVYVTWMGDIFMRGLKMVIVPLVFSSIISGVSSIGTAENLGRLGLKTMAFYMLTSLLAIITGLAVVNIVEPGKGFDISLNTEVEGLNLARGSFGTTLLNIVPNNLFQAFMEADMLAIIFFAVLFGYFISQSSLKSRKTLTDFFNSVFEVMMKLTMYILNFTPFGIFGIMAGIVAEQINEGRNLFHLFTSLGWYSFTILLGIFIHFFITLPLIVRFIGKANPLQHFRNMRAALVTAFSTCSSGATLSLTIEGVENKSGVSTKVSSFVLPLGATINMDGTALYECVAAVFIAQSYGYDLSFLQQLVIVITALLASIGAASIPMAGLVMLSIVLTAVGLPLEGVGLILAVDRILDMFRTATNVWSDTCGAVVIAKSEGEELNV